MKHNRLSELAPEKRAKILNVLKKEALFAVKNYRLNLNDWKKQYDVLKLLIKYEFVCENLKEALLTVDVATRIPEEDEVLMSLREEIKSQEVALVKVPKKIRTI